MTIDRDVLLGTRIADGMQVYTLLETRLYALALGLGCSALDERSLHFLLGSEPPVLPTFACVLAHPGHWLSDPATGIDYRKVLHVYQRLECHAPLMPAGTVNSRSRVLDVFDRGAAKGALVLAERVLTDEAGLPLATMVNGSLCRADGGFGGQDGGPGRPGAMPARAADWTWERAVPAQAALLYSLLGDRNPIHIDPQAARRAGFAHPILHGLATFGIAGRALVETCVGGAVGHLRTVECGFVSPAFPGDHLRVDMWDEGGEVRFRVVASNREAMLIGGTATFT